MKRNVPSPHGMAGDALRAARSLTSDQQTVLRALCEAYDTEWGFNYRSFRYLAKATMMNSKRVRVVVRQLARKRLAEYACGLLDVDGKVAGSGYAATLLGNIVARIITDEKAAPSD